MEEGGEDVKAGECCHAVAAEGGAHGAKWLLVHVATFGEKFVGVAYQFFKQGFREQITGLQRQLLFNNLLCGQPGARMTLCHAGKQLIDPLPAQQVGTECPVGYIRGIAVTPDGGRMCHEDAYIVEHRGRLNITLVKGETTLAGYAESHIGHLP